MAVLTNSYDTDATRSERLSRIISALWRSRTVSALSVCVLKHIRGNVALPKFVRWQSITTMIRARFAVCYASAAILPFTSWKSTARIGQTVPQCI
jgi:hypothetical protein